MNLFKMLTNKKIKSLEAKVSELKAFKTIYESRYDNWAKRIVYTFSPEDLIKYLKLKAEFNLKVSKHIGWQYEDSTPQILEDEMPHLMSAVSNMQKKYLADLEASGLYLESVSTEESK